MEMVYLSGILEVLFGILVMIPSTQEVGAWGIIAVLIGVFPANIDMLVNNKSKKLWYTVVLLDPASDSGMVDVLGLDVYLIFSKNNQLIFNALKIQSHKYFIF